MMEALDFDQRKPLPNYLLDAAGISIERMPMLNVIFDRMAASCTDSLQPIAGTPCYFSVNGITNAIVAPDSTDTLPGQDSFVQLAGPSAAEMLLVRDIAMPLNFTGEQRRNDDECARAGE